MSTFKIFPFILGFCTVSFSIIAKPLSIGISQVIKHPALDLTYKGIIDELCKHGLCEEKKNLVIMYEDASGQVSLATQIAKKFRSSNLDFWIGLGTVPSQALVSQFNSYTPIIFASVTDPIKASLIKDRSSNNKICGVSNFIDVTPQLQLIKTILPKSKTIGIIYNPGEINSVSMIEKIKFAAKDLQIMIREAPATKTVEVSTAAKSIATQVDAFFISNDNTALSAITSIVKVAREFKKPLFVSDTDLVSSGAIAALGPNQYMLGQQVANIILETIKGHNPCEKNQIFYPEATSLVLNEKESKYFAINFSDNLRQKADEIIQ